MANPYNDLISIFREEGNHFNSPSFYFATVTNGYPNLKVMFDDIEIDENMLLIDSWLLRQQTQIETETMENHSHTIKTLSNALKKGDRVVLLRDGEKFIILSKAVKL